MKPSKIKVTVLDTETGESEVKFVPEDSFIIVTAGRCHISNRSIHANGTTQLTLKVSD